MATYYFKFLRIIIILAGLGEYKITWCAHIIWKQFGTLRFYSWTQFPIIFLANQLKSFKSDKQVMKIRFRSSRAHYCTTKAIISFCSIRRMGQSTTFRASIIINVFPWWLLCCKAKLCDVNKCSNISKKIQWKACTLKLLFLRPMDSW